MTDKLYWVWLSQKLGAGNAAFLTLVEKFGSAYDVFRAEEEELYRIDGVGERTLNLLLNKNLEQASKTVEYCANKKINIITYESPEYPSRLKTLRNPPAVLYVKGKLPDFDSRVAIGVVGTRNSSEYGKRSAYKISYELATAGAVVVSGMAIGIDAMASVGALEAGGSTVAVLGCGVDVVYPALHKTLYAEIAAKGAIVSEYPPETPPEKFNFPVRNRLISGLCQGTLVVEADTRSGALITAREAILQGRDLFAVPGNLENRTSNGTNQLIRDGASVALCAKDILTNYEFLYGRSLNLTKLSLLVGESEFRPEAELRYRLVRNVRTEVHPDGGIRNDTVKPVPAAKTANRTEPQTKETKEKTNAPNDGVSQKTVDELPEKQRKTFDAIPLDRAASMDELLKCGLSVSEIVTSLTMLEIKGLISSLPGGMYIRR